MKRARSSEPASIGLHDFAMTADGRTGAILRAQKVGPGMVGDTLSDPTREIPIRYWDPGRRLLKCIRDEEALRPYKDSISRFRRRVIVIRYRFWSVVSGADIPFTCAIGKGLLIPHPNGIVIHPEAIIGMNCLIMQQVTIGTLEMGGVPVIEDQVDIGAGAKILGNVRIGKNAKIGANAVVLSDVPSGAVAVGVPARIV